MGRLGKVNKDYLRLLRKSPNKQADKNRILSVAKCPKTKRKHEKVFVYNVSLYK